MSRKLPANHAKAWTEADLSMLRQLIRANTPTRIMGLKLGRTEASVRSKAFQEQISLKPTNQSPYNRRR